jgi:hypothetical protein
VKSAKGPISNPKSEILDWTDARPITDFGFKMQESSDFKIFSYIGARFVKYVVALAGRNSRDINGPYSHSIVAGGLDVMS